MKRRSLLMALAPSIRAPSNEKLMNEFADLYNRYVARLHDGILDVKLWSRVCAVWEKINE